MRIWTDAELAAAKEEALSMGYNLRGGAEVTLTAEDFERLAQRYHDLDAPPLPRWERTDPEYRRVQTVRMRKAAERLEMAGATIAMPPEDEPS